MGFLWHTTTNFELSHSAPNYNATLIKHKAIIIIQCACFCLNYPACKSPLCGPRLSHHLWVCGLSFSPAIFAVPSKTAWGGGTWNTGFSLLYNVYLKRCSALLSYSANCLTNFFDFNQIKFSWKKLKSSMLYCVKIRRVGAELFHVGRQTERQTRQGYQPPFRNSRNANNKTWVTRTERHVPQTVMIPLTPLLSHHFITSSLSTANITFDAFPLQTLSFRQPTVSVQLAQTKHDSTPFGRATTSFRWTDGDKRSCCL